MQHLSSSIREKPETKRSRVQSLSVVELQPSGYPFRIAGEDSPIALLTDDVELFQAYAREQWAGIYIKKGDYLFDQLVFPDFAFKVSDTHPNQGRISFSTRFILKRKPLIQEKRLKVHFSDIVGQSEAKNKCLIIKKYLEKPEAFGDWAPRNILFYGSPGTGKTMVAQALANETNAPFYLVKSTDLIGVNVGDASRRVHQIFKIASDNAPSVLYLDEIDAIGLDRSFQNIRGDVSEIVSALLGEMDGLSANFGVVCIGATNNPVIIDKAIRSRFEEEIEFKLPSMEDREQILRLYIKKVPMPVKADLKKIVKETEGFSGRDLKDKILKAALHKAILQDEKCVTQEIIDSILSQLNEKSSKEKPRMFT
ncbi:MAG: AAA family ATPase [Candidatus Jordarchaeum sp.]|uniref:AAA family ATPase n=1 Tax=Candidatus Jordarchaeum sp. TaxID=2823881 RepID=UPI004049560C